MRRHARSPPRSARSASSTCSTTSRAKRRRACAKRRREIPPSRAGRISTACCSRAKAISTAPPPSSAPRSRCARTTCPRCCGWATCCSMARASRRAATPSRALSPSMSTRRRRSTASAAPPSPRATTPLPSSATQAALAAQPGAGSVHYRLGLAYRALGSVERSRAELERSNQEPVTFPDPVLDASRRRVTGVGALILVGQIAARASADATAEARFREAIALDAQSPEAHHALGAFLEERGRASEAIEEYVRALDLGVANPGLALHTGRLLIECGPLSRCGRDPRARGRSRRRTRASSPASWRRRWPRQGSPSGRSPPTIARSSSMLDPSERARLLFHRATLLADAGRPALAEADLREAVRLAPDLAAAHFNLGTLCARRGDLAEAATHLARAVDLEPENAQAQLSLGMALVLLDRPLDARARLEDGAGRASRTTSRSSTCWRACSRAPRTRRRATPSARWCLARELASARGRPPRISRRWRWRSRRSGASTTRSHAQERAVAASPQDGSAALQRLASSKPRAPPGRPIAKAARSSIHGSDEPVANEKGGPERPALRSWCSGHGDRRGDDPSLEPEGHVRPHLPRQTEVAADRLHLALIVDVDLELGIGDVGHLDPQLTAHAVLDREAPGAAQVE